MTISVTRTRARPRWRTRYPWSYATLIIVCLLSLWPFVLLALSSLKGESGKSWDSFGLWSALFSQLDTVRYMLNAAALGLVTVAIVVAVSSLAGFGFAKLVYPGSGVIFVILVVCILVPIPTIILPEYINVSKAGLLSGYEGALLVFVGTGIPFAVVLMSGYFRALPDSIMESAILDGASYTRACASVFVPMARPVMATVAALQFVTVWNSLLISLLFLPNPKDWTIGVALATLSGTHIANTNILLTGSLVSTIPTLFVYVFFQKYLISGVTAGVEL